MCKFRVVGFEGESGSRLASTESETAVNETWRAFYVVFQTDRMLICFRSCFPDVIFSFECKRPKKIIECADEGESRLLDFQGSYFFMPFDYVVHLPFEIEV